MGRSFFVEVTDQELEDRSQIRVVLDRPLSVVFTPEAVQSGTETQASVHLSYFLWLHCHFLIKFCPIEG